jgi:hypothetical protein
MERGHKHDYETIYHPSPAPKARALGIEAAEIRRCKTCQKEMTFVFVRNEWFSLFEDLPFEDQGVLLA